MSEYLIPLSIQPLDEGGYLATSSVLQGLIAQGRTVAETLEIAEDVARKLIESRIEHGDFIPKEIGLKPPLHKKFDLKIPVPIES